MNQKQPFVTFPVKRVLRVLSPCILAIILCAVMIILGLLDMEKSEGWSFLAVIVFLPAGFLLSVIDFIIKSLLRNNVLAIWIIELLIIGIGILYVITHIYG